MRCAVLCGLTLVALVRPVALVPQINAPRVWLPEPTLVATFEDVDGSLFGDPGFLRAKPAGGFLIADWLGRTIRSFDTHGRREWSFGRSGAGPGEFAHFTDLEYDAHGQLVVLDTDRGRITEIDSTGKLVDTDIIAVGEVRELLPSFRQEQWTVIPRLNSKTLLWISISANGRRIEHSLETPFPVDDDIVAESFASPTYDGGAVVTFRWSSPHISH